MSQPKGCDLDSPAGPITHTCKQSAIKLPGLCSSNHTLSRRQIFRARQLSLPCAQPACLLAPVPCLFDFNHQFATCWHYATASASLCVAWLAPVTPTQYMFSQNAACCSHFLCCCSTLVSTPVLLSPLWQKEGDNWVLLKLLWKKQKTQIPSLAHNGYHGQWLTNVLNFLWGSPIPQFKDMIEPGQTQKAVKKSKMLSLKIQKTANNMKIILIKNWDLSNYQRLIHSCEGV